MAELLPTYFERPKNGTSLGSLKRNDERLDRLEPRIEILSAESDRRFPKLIEALNHPQDQTDRRLDAINLRLLALSRRLEGLDLRPDLIEENLS